MVQIKSVVTALLSVSLATCSPLVQRSAATVLADITAIGNDITTLTTAVTAYTGGLAGALTIANYETVLDTAVNQATTDAKAATAFSVADSGSVVIAIDLLAPQIVNGLSALSSKESLFAASGLTSLVQGLLQTLQADNDALGAALQAKAQTSDVAILVAIQSEIDSAFTSAIAAY